MDIKTALKTIKNPFTQMFIKDELIFQREMGGRHIPAENASTFHKLISELTGLPIPDVRREIRREILGNKKGFNFSSNKAYLQ